MRRLVFLLPLVVMACAHGPGASESVVDQQRIDRVERAASVNGTRVIWLRLPTRSVKSAPVS